MITIPGRIPIQIFPIFWFLIFALGGINSDFALKETAIWAVVIFFSVLIHEYGHALTALAFGQKALIQLVGMGGITQREGSRLKLWQEFIVVLNGPLAGFLLSVIAYIVLIKLGMESSKPSSSALAYALNVTVWANVFWTIINLLPIYPLDGGHLSRIILESIFGVRGVKGSLLISCALSILIGLLFFMMQSIVAGAIFMMLAFESYRAWKSSLAMTSVDQDSSLRELFQSAENDMKSGREDEAARKLTSIREMTGEGLIYVAATEYLASMLYHQGHDREAYDLLRPLESLIQEDALQLLHRLACRVGDWKMAASIGDRAYQAYPNYETAFDTAVAYASLGEAEPAVGWLQRAIEDGLPDPKLKLAKTEFDPVRRNEAFREIESGL